MSTHPLVERYLARLSAELSSMTAFDRQEVLGEITNHIAEATAAGRPVDAVLEALGPADALARGYCVELLLHPKPTSPPVAALDRFLRVAALVLLGSLPSFIIIVILGAVGVSFFFSGIAVFVAGVAVQISWLPIETIDVDARLAMLVGPLLAAVGALALGALYAYVRVAIVVIRKVLPARRD